MDGENLQTEYRTIYFKLLGKKNGRGCWICRTITDNKEIAVLEWDKEWEGYGVEAKAGMFLHKEAVSNILHFMEKLSE